MSDPDISTMHAMSSLQRMHGEAEEHKPQARTSCSPIKTLDDHAFAIEVNRHTIADVIALRSALWIDGAPEELLDEEPIKLVAAWRERGCPPLGREIPKTWKGEPMNTSPSKTRQVEPAAPVEKPPAKRVKKPKPKPPARRVPPPRRVERPKWMQRARRIESNTNTPNKEG